ncbi:hypothetical protein A3Q56_01875 [Intoshia linei]|uniref:Cyclic nucleotide-binding domain-containing protein n=1 Tax=Intoshia linei TaxID=1819745 RepID=A0A177B7S1_9BILA|nr:hypothetical protein A3Q56_01875 [Intoshia linei]
MNPKDINKIENSISATIAQFKCIKKHKNLSCATRLKKFDQIQMNEIIADFKKYIKIVILLIKFLITLEKRFIDSKSNRKYRNTVDSTQVDDNLIFNVSEFRATSHISISQEIKNIISMPMEERNQAQIKIIMNHMQRIESFAEYPIHIQQLLCKVCTLQRIPAGRVIIRYGHIAENYYIILSGTVEISIIDKFGNKNIVAILGKGKSFGVIMLTLMLI